MPTVEKTLNFNTARNESESQFICSLNFAHPPKPPGAATALPVFEGVALSLSQIPLRTGLYVYRRAICPPPGFFGTDCAPVFNPPAFSHTCAVHVQRTVQQPSGAQPGYMYSTDVPVLDLLYLVVPEGSLVPVI